MVRNGDFKASHRLEGVPVAEAQDGGEGEVLREGHLMARTYSAEK